MEHLLGAGTCSTCQHPRCFAQSTPASSPAQHQPLHRSCATQKPAQAALSRPLAQALVLQLLQGGAPQRALACCLLRTLAYDVGLQLHAQDCAALLSALWHKVRLHSLPGAARRACRSN